MEIMHAYYNTFEKMYYSTKTTFVPMGENKVSKDIYLISNFNCSDPLDKDANISICSIQIPTIAVYTGKTTGPVKDRYKWISLHGVYDNFGNMICRESKLAFANYTEEINNPGKNLGDDIVLDASGIPRYTASKNKIRDIGSIQHYMNYINYLIYMSNNSAYIKYDDLLTIAKLFNTISHHPLYTRKLIEGTH